MPDWPRPWTAPKMISSRPPRSMTSLSFVLNTPLSRSESPGRSMRKPSTEKSTPVLRSDPMFWSWVETAAPEIGTTRSRSSVVFR